MGPGSSSNFSLQPLFPTGHHTSLQFRVPNQSYQATTESTANPGTGSGLQSEIHTTPATVGLTLSKKEVMRRNIIGLSPVLFDPGYHQVQEPSRPRQPPYYSGHRRSARLRPSHVSFPRGEPSRLWVPSAGHGFSGLGHSGPEKWTDEDRRMRRVKAAAEGVLLATEGKKKKKESRGRGRGAPPRRRPPAARASVEGSVIPSLTHQEQQGASQVGEGWEDGRIHGNAGIRGRDRRWPLGLGKGWVGLGKGWAPGAGGSGGISRQRHPVLSTRSSRGEHPGQLPERPLNPHFRVPPTSEHVGKRSP